MQGNSLNIRFTPKDGGDDVELDPITQANRDKLLKKITPVHEALKNRTLGFGVIRTIPEFPFKMYFLPAFAGLFKDPAVLDKMVAKWIAIAGQVHREVQVVDTEGKLMFTVPPLQTLDIFDATKQGIVPISSIIKRSERVKSIAPNRYNSALQASLEQTLFDRINPEAVEKTYQQWSEMFSLYLDHLKQLCAAHPDELIPWPGGETQGAQVAAAPSLELADGSTPVAQKEQIGFAIDPDF